MYNKVAWNISRSRKYWVSNKKNYGDIQHIPVMLYFQVSMLKVVFLEFVFQLSNFYSSVGMEYVKMFSVKFRIFNFCNLTTENLSLKKIFSLIQLFINRTLYTFSMFSGRTFHTI